MIRAGFLLSALMMLASAVIEGCRGNYPQAFGAVVLYLALWMIGLSDWMTNDIEETT